MIYRDFTNSTQLRINPLPVIVLRQTSFGVPEPFDCNPETRGPWQSCRESPVLH